MLFNGISISDGNMKIGATPSFSVSPVVTCRADAPCCKECYARKMAARYPTCRRAYDRNTVAVIERTNDVFNALWAYLISSGSNRFRFNVAGDFFSEKYLAMAFDLAAALPSVQFLAYTKQYELVNEYITKRKLPDNFTMILSAWDSFIPENPHNLTMAWYQDGTCNVPDKAFTCPGKCGACGFKCWNMKGGENVVFNKH